MSGITPAYLTPKQASEYLQIPEDTLREWRSRRSRIKGPRAVRMGKHTRYPLADLVKWAEARDTQ